MAVNKVEFGNETLIDLTGDTVTPENLLKGATAHGANGEPIEGEFLLDTVNVVNVREHGVIGNGSVDDTESIQNLLDTVDSGVTLYFPQGIYNVSDTLVVKKHMNIIGETRYGTFQSTANKIHSASTLNYTGDANKSLLKKDGENYINLFIQNVSFYGNSYNVEDSGHTSKTGDYGKYYTATAVNENVNGIDLTDSNGAFFISDCYFQGFSGAALTLTQHKKVFNCGFYKCNVGVLPLTYDCLIDYSWFSRCSIGIKSTTINTLGVYNSWFDQMEQHAIYSESQITLNMTGCWIDMVDYSGIYCKSTLANSRIDARISRCGMSYAGASKTDISSAEGYKACALFTHVGTSCYINITPQRRAITPSVADSICPTAIFGSSSGIKDSIVVCPTDTNDSPDDHLALTTTAFKNTVFADGAQIQKMVGAYKSTVVGITIRPNDPPAAWKAMNAGDFFINSKTHALFYANSTTAGDYIQIVGAHEDVDAKDVTYHDTNVEEALDDVIESIPTKLSELAGDESHRTVTDYAMRYWNDAAEKSLDGHILNTVTYPYTDPDEYEDKGVTFKVNEYGGIIINGTPTGGYAIFHLCEGKKEKGTKNILLRTENYYGTEQKNVRLEMYRGSDCVCVNFAGSTSPSGNHFSEPTGYTLQIVVTGTVSNMLVYPLCYIREPRSYEPPKYSNLTLDRRINEASNPTFEEASEVSNVESGDSVPTLFGKIKKVFSTLFSFGVVAEDDEEFEAAELRDADILGGKYTAELMDGYMEQTVQAMTEMHEGIQQNAEDISNAKKDITAINDNLDSLFLTKNYSAGVINVPALGTWGANPYTLIKPIDGYSVAGIVGVSTNSAYVHPFNIEYKNSDTGLQVQNHRNEQQVMVFTVVALYVKNN